MATGYTQAELDALLLILEDAVPIAPSPRDKRDAERVVVMRYIGSELGIVLNIETGGSRLAVYWLNCLVAKELAAAIKAVLEAFDWPQPHTLPDRQEGLPPLKPLHLGTAIEVNSLSSFADSDGMLVRFAMGHRARYVTLFFLPVSASELMGAILEAAVAATWWDTSSELIPKPTAQE